MLPVTALVLLSFSILFSTGRVSEAECPLVPISFIERCIHLFGSADFYNHNFTLTDFLQ